MDVIFCINAKMLENLLTIICNSKSSDTNSAGYNCLLFTLLLIDLLCAAIFITIFFLNDDEEPL